MRVLNGKRTSGLIDPDRLKIGGLYFFFGAGGLWQLLGMFQALMKDMASLVLVILSVWIAIEYCLCLDKAARTRFLLWALFVLAGSIGIEWAGVETGQLFGPYTYGETLRPFIGPVPLAIGFAWLVTILSSAATVQKFFVKTARIKGWRNVLLIAGVMVVFDLLMEPAAMKLGYWVWKDYQIPVQNYVTWFLAGSLFVFVGQRFDVFQKKLPRIAMHAYFAQAVYFVLVHFS